MCRPYATSTGTIPKELGDLPVLTVLNLDNNRLEGEYTLLTSPLCISLAGICTSTPGILSGESLNLQAIPSQHILGRVPSFLMIQGIWNAQALSYCPFKDTLDPNLSLMMFHHTAEVMVPASKHSAKHPDPGSFRDARKRRRTDILPWFWVGVRPVERPRTLSNVL